MDGEGDHSGRDKNARIIFGGLPSCGPTSQALALVPILAGVRSPRRGRKPVTWTNVDRDYEKIRIDMQTLFQDLGIRAAG